MTLVWYELHFPGDLDGADVVHFVRTLAARPRHGLFMTAYPVVCQVEGVAGHVTWRLGFEEHEHAQMLARLRLALPRVELTASDYGGNGVQVGEQQGDGHHSVRTRYNQVWELRLSSQRRPLFYKAPEQVAGAVLAVLAGTQPGEHVLLEWVIGPWLPRSAVRPPSRPSNHDATLDLGQLVLDSEQTKALRDKVAEPIFGAVGRIAVSANTRQRQRVLRQAVIGGLQLLRAPGVGIERRAIPWFLTKRRLMAYQRPVVSWPLCLNAAELTACLCWPVQGLVLPGDELLGHRRLPPNRQQLVPLGKAVLADRITGTSAFPGLPGLLNLRIDDALRGLHVIGPTGTGKSNLLASQVLQDIAAGRGGFVVDPKRDLAEAIADRIPRNRVNDVVLIDPSDLAPVGINVLKGADADWVADLIIHVFQELFPHNWGQRSADVIHNSVLTLVKHGGTSLCEIVPLLTNAPFRKMVTSELRQDVLGVGPFWHFFDSLSEAERMTIVAPVLNKLRSFVNRKAVRAVIGQSQGFDLSTVFTQKKVVLINLATGDAGSETGQLLGALILGRIWATIQARTHVPPERRHPTFLVIDEFADILKLPGDLGEMLAKTRGYGVSMTLGHQHLAQLPANIRSAVAANLRSRIAFQCGYDDAAILAKVMGGGLTGDDIQNLPRFETYQVLCVNGRTLPPASATTLPLSRPLGTLDEVRALSRQRYGVPREETDRQLIARRTVAVPDVEVGSRRRRIS